MQIIHNQTENFFFRFTALSPIMQTSETDHNGKPKLRTLKTFLAGENHRAEVPIISGNSFRGRMRREIAYALFDALDIDVKAVYANGTGAEKETFHILTSGGTLKTNEKKELFDADAVTKVQQLLPILTLFGGSYAGGMWNGKFASMNAKPATLDLENTFPEAVHHWLDDRSSQVTYTNTRAALENSGGEYTIYRLPDRSTVDLPDDEENVNKKGDSAYRNMPISFDYIVPGTRMIWQIVTNSDLTPLEYSMLGFALRRIFESSFLGGKLQAGCGLVSWINGLDQLDERFSPELFLADMASRKEELVALLTDPKGLFAEAKAIAAKRAAENAAKNQKRKEEKAAKEAKQHTNPDTNTDDGE